MYAIRKSSLSSWRGRDPHSQMREVDCCVSICFADELYFDHREDCRAAAEGIVVNPMDSPALMSEANFTSLLESGDWLVKVSTGNRSQAGGQLSEVSCALSL